MGTWVAYYRVSTARQGHSGLGLEAQRASVQRALAGQTLLAEFTEIESGRLNDRVQLGRAINLARLTGSRLIVAKLDRLSRNASFLLQLADAGLDFICADMPHATRLTVGIMALVAEQEALAISVRTREALAAARARGVKLGGDRGNLGQCGQLGRRRSAEVRHAQAIARRDQLLPHLEAARAEGHTSYRALADYLNSRQITTARGGLWHPASVARLLLLS